jgi:hypothetical protein
MDRQQISDGLRKERARTLISRREEARETEDNCGGGVRVRGVGDLLPFISEKSGP